VPVGVSTDPDLGRLVAAWADLPLVIRAGIVAMVEASGGDEAGEG
jgi:hypothetical protein